MPEIYVITKTHLPNNLMGSDSGYALRAMTVKEVVSVEDRLFTENQDTQLGKGLAAVILPVASITSDSIEDHETLAEFALSLLALSGRPSFVATAVFAAGLCTHAKIIGHIQNTEEPAFSSLMNGRAASQWMRRCAQARGNLKERMHITAIRYIRFLRTDNLTDALMDLCISLESLFDAQTEISFRFGACLAKFTGEKGARAQESADLLSDLYALRSKIAHGDPKAAKLLKQIEPQIPRLRVLSRKILTGYIMFMSSHSRTEWESHLKACLFS
jgi:hypothetical protein